MSINLRENVDARGGLAHLETSLRRLEVRFRDVAERRAEIAQRSHDPPHVLRARFDPDVEVLGRSWSPVNAYRVAAHDQETPSRPFRRDLLTPPKTRRGVSASVSAFGVAHFIAAAKNKAFPVELTGIDPACTESSRFGLAGVQAGRMTGMRRVLQHLAEWS